MCEECACVKVKMCVCSECMQVNNMTVYIVLLCTSIYGIVDPMTLYFLFL